MSLCNHSPHAAADVNVSAVCAKAFPGVKQLSWCRMPVEVGNDVKLKVFTPPFDKITAVGTGSGLGSEPVFCQ